MNFVSGGLRKTAAEEKQHQQKGEEGSDDSDDDSPSAPPPSRSTAPKKLQMVNFVLLMLFSYCSISMKQCFVKKLIKKNLLGYFPGEPVPEVCRRHTDW